MLGWEFEGEWEGVDGRFWRAEKGGRDIISKTKMTYHDILRKHECLWRGSVTA